MTAYEELLTIEEHCEALTRAGVLVWTGTRENGLKVFTRGPNFEESASHA
ncbi:MAG: hypothetical protein H0W97_02055 [Actinobacteria bacterium]|nr:hypothetical protein [Actinomycetota bacterium]